MLASIFELGSIFFPYKYVRFAKTLQVARAIYIKNYSFVGGYVVDPWWWCCCCCPVMCPRLYLFSASYITTMEMRTLSAQRISWWMGSEHLLYLLGKSFDKLNQRKKNFFLSDAHAHARLYEINVQMIDEFVYYLLYR